MKEYILSNDVREDYNGMILCLSYESIFTYLHNIENESLILNTKGKLLIDQLLITGNTENRYISCLYDYGSILISSAQYVRPDHYYKSLSCKILKNNIDCLKNSILSNQQIEFILNDNII